MVYHFPSFTVDSLITGCHLLGVQFITSLKSNSHIALPRQNTTQNKSINSHPQDKTALQANVQGLIKKYPTIFFPFKQVYAWGWDWGACNRGPPCACVNYCLPLGLLSCWQSAKTCHCACRARCIDDDRESWVRICIKFCQKLRHSCSETYNMNQKAFENEAMGRMHVKDWFRLFKEGQMSAENERSGRPSSSRI
jgi:hypothetical protein